VLKRENAEKYGVRKKQKVKNAEWQLKFDYN